jgi:hypothetical protein
MFTLNDIPTKKKKKTTIENQCFTINTNVGSYLNWKLIIVVLRVVVLKDI